MSAFLAEIGTKLADRWLSMLVLPGLLWVGTLALAVRLGQARPLDPGPLRGWLGQIAADPAAHNASAILLAAAAALLASSAAGLLADALGGLIQRLWGATGTLPPLTWVTGWRKRRWHGLTEHARRAVARASDPNPQGGPLVGFLARLAAERANDRRRDRPAEPGRPTRIGDEFHACAARVRDVYDLELEPTWPRLWPLLPGTLRTDLAGARDSYSAAARLAAWGLMYIALAAAWWPAAIIGAAAVAAAVGRARGSAHALAVLVETAVDLHIGDLAEKLGIPADPLSPAKTGQAISQRLRLTLPRS